ncbi:UDP-N-acetylmuramate--L-alanine ligase [Verrucomicrobiota bacterium]
MKLPVLMDDTEALQRLLNAKAGHIHLVGACGVGMAGLAFHLSERGFQVSGCDISCNHLAAWLEECGIPVACGHNPAHLSGVDCVVRSTAVCLTHPEVSAASASGVPVFRRGHVLASLLTEFSSVLVSGTHGKTTIASMIVQVLRTCGVTPAFCIGGESEKLGGVAGSGESGVMVVEADESDGTLAYYESDIAVISNIEFDHAEYFESVEALVSCFESMAQRVKTRLVFCADDPRARLLCEGMEKAFSYGLGSSADLRATDVVETGAGTKFRVRLRGSDQGELSVPVPGRHNVLNALAACAVAIEKNVPFSDIREGLSGFEPVRRRFERIVENDEVLVVSDYAHHPSEVAALKESAGLLDRSRWLAVFQPHRFSRTCALGADFPPAFEGMDELVLVPVYAASEESVPGGTSWDLYRRFREAGKTNTTCASCLSQAWDYLRRALRKGDGLLIIGAGDVAEIAEWARTAFASGGLDCLDPAGGWEEALAGLGLQATTVKVREPMARRTTLQVGGYADIFLGVGCESDLARIFEWTTSHQVPVTVLGAGSNVLVSDLGIRGVVLCLDSAGFGSMREETDNRVIVGSVVVLNTLMTWLAEHGKSGLSFLNGIPGTVGGALRMNAGAWGQNIGEHVVWVRVLNPDGSVEVLEKQSLRFAYRECESLRDSVVLEAALQVEQSDPADIRSNLEAVAQHRAWMRGLRSAGSVFRNPGEDYAGRLIEQAGMKGFRVGGARVSKEHANVIVTEKGATASDVNALIGIIQNKVKKHCGVDLVKELVCLG